MKQFPPADQLLPPTAGIRTGKDRVNAVAPAETQRASPAETPKTVQTPTEVPKAVQDPAEVPQAAQTSQVVSIPAEKPPQKATLEDLQAAGNALSITQKAYATVGFLKLPSDQAGRLKDAFMGMEPSKLGEVAHSLAQLDSSSLKQTIQLMGGLNQERLNSTTQWMQDPEQLGKMTSALKGISSDELARMNPDQFHERLQSAVAPPVAPAQRPVEMVPTQTAEQPAPREPSRQNIDPPIEKLTTAAPIEKPIVASVIAQPAAARAKERGAPLDPMSKMMANLTDEQKRKLTPEVIEKGMKTMEQLHLKPEDIAALGKKFSSLLPKDSNGKGFDTALLAMDKLKPAQIKPILEFAQDISVGDARLMKSIGGNSMPSNPERLIDQAARMSPQQIEHKLDQVRQGLALYHAIPPAFRGIAKSFFVSYGRRSHF
jgi:hypothetical protein